MMKQLRLLAMLALVAVAATGCVSSATLFTRLPNGGRQIDVVTQAAPFAPRVDTQYYQEPGNHRMLAHISTTAVAPPETGMASAAVGGLSSGLFFNAFGGLFGTGSTHVGSIVNVNKNTQIAPTTTIVH